MKLHDELEKLKATAREASEAHRKAKHSLERDTWKAAREVTRNLLDYRDDIAFHRPKATPEAERPKRAQELTKEFCAELLKRGLILEAAGNGGGVAILDHLIDKRFFETNQAAIKARAAVKRFEADNAEGLSEEERKADAEKIKDALDSGDGDRICEALGVKG